MTSKAVPPDIPGCSTNETEAVDRMSKRMPHSYGDKGGQELQHVCQACGEVFLQARLLKRHLATDQEGRQFPCSLCGAAFVRLACLNVHVRTHMIVCHQCLVAFISENSFRKHTCRSSDEIVYDCKNCGKEFKQKHQLLDHIAQTHMIGNGFACENCGKEMPTAAYLTRHKKSCGTQGARSFSCPECEAIFRSLSGLRLHLLSHAGEKPYACLECGASFKTQTYLSCHIKRKHCKDRPFSCQSCSKAFPFQSALNFHMKSHHPESNDMGSAAMRNFQASNMNKQTIKVPETVFIKSQINQRLQSADAVATPASDSDSTSKQETQYHRRHKTEPLCDPLSAEQDNDSQSGKVMDVFAESLSGDQEMAAAPLHQPEVPDTQMSEIHSQADRGGQGLQYVCQTCGEAFAQARLLKRHLYVEQEGKEFTCSLCGAAFLRLACLNVHMRGHATVCDQCNVVFISDSSYRKHTCRLFDENMFDCKHCGEKFRQKSELLEHIQTHTSESGCICENCGKEMPTVTYLTRHKKSCAAQGARYSCPECESVFRSLSGLRLHLLSHAGEKPHTCLECGASFKVQTYLSCHIKRKHCKERPFSCQHCSKAFPFQSALNFHIKCHHSDMKDKPSEQPTVKIVRGSEHSTGSTVDNQNKIRNAETRIFTASQSRSLMPVMDTTSNSETDVSREELNNPESSFHTEKGAWPEVRMDASTGLGHNEDQQMDEAVASQPGQVSDMDLTPVPELDQNSLEKRYACETCGETYSTAHLLTRHQRIQWEGERYPCYLCEAVFPRTSCLHVHLRDHTFVCEQCQVVFVSESSLKGHTCDSSQNMYECKKCKKDFRERIELDEHIQTHIMEHNFICEYCGKQLPTAAYLARHKKSCATQSAKFACPKCKTMSGSLMSLRSHIKEKHTSDRSFFCTMCGRGFALKHRLDSHKKIHIDHRKKRVVTGTQALYVGRMSREKRKRTETNSDDSWDGLAGRDGVCEQNFVVRGGLSDGGSRELDQESSSDAPFENSWLWSQQSETSSRNMVSSSQSDLGGTGEGPHTCHTCGTPFQRAFLLKRHLDTQQEGKQYPCSLCEQVFPRSGCLHVHMQNHSFVCEQCQVVFITESSFKHHSCRGSEGNVYRCQKCSEVFRNQAELVEHIQLHITEKGCICKKCGKELASSGYLERHKKTCGVHSAKFSCPQCKELFQTIRGLKLHLQSHSGVKPYTCEECGISFKAQQYLQCHKKQIHSSDRPFLCSHCPKAFAFKHRLNAHMKEHMSTGQHMCQQCGSSCKTAEGLKCHLETHSEERPYVCNKCGRGFKQRTVLIRHVMTHTGVRGYKCRFCEAAFVHLSSLSRHERTHTGDRPYICEFCSASFPDSGTLVIHRRLHTGEKPYACYCCAMRFSDPSSMRKHLKGKHGVEKPVCRTEKPDSAAFLQFALNNISQELKPPTDTGLPCTASV